MLYFHSWSGGKDSTASIILDHMHGLPPSTVIFSEVMFDKKRGISGELPEHIDFIYNKAIPRFNEWGYDVHILRADIDYLDLFYHVLTNSKKHPDRNGKYSGFVIGGMCAANSRLKIAPIRRFYKSVVDDYVQYVGIAVDEPKRLKRLNGTNKVSLLVKYGYTESMAYDLCKQYDLLSPIYNYSVRGGCWFCPNSHVADFAYIKEVHFDLWNELRMLSCVDNLVSDKFFYGLTFDDCDKKVDKFLEDKYYQSLQLSLFD